MAKHKRLGYALSVAAMCGVMVPFNAFATDLSGSATFNDGIGGISTVTKSYDADNDMTVLNVTTTFNDAALAKVLAQKGGNGSYPGVFYSTVNPGLGWIAGGAGTIYKNVVDADTEAEVDTKAEVDALLLENDEFCHASGDECAAEDYVEAWASSNDASWPGLFTVQYKTDMTTSGWVAAYWRYNGTSWERYRVNGTTMPAISIGDRLVDVLGLESQDELVYGENWRLAAPSYTSAWVYAKGYDASLTGSERWNTDQTEYIRINYSAECAFDYAGTNDDKNFVRYESLEEALAGGQPKVILNKDTTVDTITIPAGKTLVEKNGELTINDTLHSSILGTYTKQDGENYHIVKLTQNNQQGNDVTMKTGLVQVDDVVDIDYAILDGFKYASTLNGEAYAEDVFVMPNADVSFVVTYSEWTITVGADEGDDSASDTVRVAIAASVTEDLKALIADGETENENLSLNDLEATKDVYKAGDQLEEYYEEWLYPSSDYYEGAEAYDKIVATMEDGEQIAAMYDGLIDLYYGNSHYGAVYGLNTPVEVRFNIPEEFRNAPAGYGRIFTIIRGHIDMNGNESATRLETSVDGTDAVAMNDKFSSFAIVYKDVPANPDTGVITRQSGSATIATIVASAFVGIMTSTVSFIYLINRRNRR